MVKGRFGKGVFFRGFRSLVAVHSFAIWGDKARDFEDTVYPSISESDQRFVKYV